MKKRYDVLQGTCTQLLGIPITTTMYIIPATRYKARKLITAARYMIPAAMYTVYLLLCRSYHCYSVEGMDDIPAARNYIAATRNTVSLLICKGFIPFKRSKSGEFESQLNGFKVIWRGRNEEYNVTLFRFIIK
jgi:hypothetical protein